MPLIYSLYTIFELKQIFLSAYALNLYPQKNAGNYLYSCICLVQQSSHIPIHFMAHGCFDIIIFFFLNSIRSHK